MNWDEFMEKERANPERRKGGELASMLGGPRQGESLEYLRRLADEDRRQAEEGLVALAGDVGARYKHTDALIPEDRPAREATESRRAAWLKERLIGPFGGVPLRHRRRGIGQAIYAGKMRTAERDRLKKR